MDRANFGGEPICWWRAGIGIDTNYKALIPMTYSVVYIFVAGWQHIVLTLNTRLCFTKPYVASVVQCSMVISYCRHMGHFKHD